MKKTHVIILIAIAIASGVIIARTGDYTTYANFIEAKEKGKSVKKEDEGEKTVSVIYESEEEDYQGKNHQFQFRGCNKKLQPGRNSNSSDHNLNSANNTTKTSQVKVIIKEEILTITGSVKLEKVMTSKKL